ncbi:ATP-dependent RNA helicase RhlE [Gimesia alba]|uniref:DEAD-box ATP-dependent RNA helicase RhpA n=1 Tax=Gimesia alba TaxID=2527973 RepID=A0A517RC23_9PLAN|nr:DEAD/DEAH box helicase [Gimesia alba]QDT41438.1 ATP-dependent RNA helicase RhlE [Gimesia alba]
MNTFQEIELIAPVQRALAEENYKTPTPIQAQTIPAALQGHDILGCAQTGTGKTAALALPILNRLGKNNRKAPPNRPFALVLAPTRELAIQIGESFETYGRHLRLRHVLVYGGVSQGNQVRALNRGAHVLIATPGRLLDLMNQGHINLEHLETFVLDEADRMLDMGFLPDLKRIISQLPAKRQSLFFSATLAPKITELAQSLLKNPVSVNVTPKTTSVKKIKQQLMHVEYNKKQPLLQKILGSDGVERALVFIRTKRTANMLAQRLMRAGFKATAIHGNKSQNARQQALEAFRSKKVQVLVATDVAARGIDIDGITHVINFDLPVEAESYVHRIGRTGRAGAEGIAISFCSGNERNELRSIEKLIGHKIPVSAEHRQSDVRPVKADLEPRTRKGAPGQRAGAKGARPPRRRSASSAAKAKPKQGQKRTKWRHLKPNAKQTS